MVRPNVEGSAVRPCNAADPVISLRARLCPELLEGVEYADGVAAEGANKVECLHLWLGTKPSGVGE
jgi:hypothetical protein